MATYISTNRTLWPRQARPQSGMSKAVIAAICVGIIAGISTSAVMSELQPSVAATPAVTPVVAEVRAEQPVLAAAPTLTRELLAAHATASQAARELPVIGPSQAAESADKGDRIASTDGRGGAPSINPAPDAAASARAPASARAQTATVPSAGTPQVAPAVAAIPAAEPAAQPTSDPAPAAKPVSQPQRVVRKRQKQPTGYSARNQNPFFPFFGGGNGFFFGGHRG